MYLNICITVSPKWNMCMCLFKRVFVIKRKGVIVGEGITGNLASESQLYQVRMSVIKEWVGWSGEELKETPNKV